jgi:hypothetical protein
MQLHAIARGKEVAIMRWRHVNGIYWHALHGQFNATGVRVGRFYS